MLFSTQLKIQTLGSRFITKKYQFLIIKSASTLTESFLHKRSSLIQIENKDCHSKSKDCLVLNK